MNGAHDLGGLHGFGPIDQGQSENFKYSWEERVFALTLACGMLGQWNLDQSRFARENMDPAHYLSSSYYEHWLHGLETLLQEREFLQDQSEKKAVTAITVEAVPEILAKGGPTVMTAESNPEFQVGDSVRVRNFNPSGHTRAPRYIRGHVGKVAHYHGAHIFPDLHAESGEKVPAHLYSIRFEAGEIWGPEGDSRSAVYVDVFEPYLES